MVQDKGKSSTCYKWKQRNNRKNLTKGTDDELTLDYLIKHVRNEPLTYSWQGPQLNFNWEAYPLDQS